ncbi:FxsA family protein [Microbulbifer pacificus]|uniref:FxsA family protein n=1 Tax=Microbulbifer pacificus TaxID=407164 RepID=UPI000CF47600|nr:FxsA family protein [Microbulbifer pacificus]
MRPFLILFIVLPILEMWLLISVGEKIGALPTIGLVLLTAMVGVALLRHQGISTLMRAQEKMRVGEVPAREMAEGVFLAVGGALLLTPGFITDTLGFICLIPGLRQLVLGKFLSRMVIVQPGYTPGADGQEPDGGRIIEGDYQREGEDKKSRSQPHNKSAEDNPHL